MYFVTGDIHGDIYNCLYFIEKYSLSKDDVVVLLGDVGLNFYRDDSDIKKKKRLNNTQVQFLCIHGNHEIRPTNIETYSEYQWNEGIVYREKAFSNINFAKDGEIYNLGGKKCIAIGGAYSVDKKYRINQGRYWWPDEQPSDEIKVYVEKKLDNNNWNIDCVFSHTCPSKYIPIEAFIGGINQRCVDKSTEEWLDTIEDKLNYQKWYCGHWHINKNIDDIHFLFNEYLEI